MHCRTPYLYILDTNYTLPLSVLKPKLSPGIAKYLPWAEWGWGEAAGCGRLRITFLGLSLDSDPYIQPPKANQKCPLIEYNLLDISNSSC